MSAKGLEWARGLRTELERRIGDLREALAGIEPLRQELVRLEEQLGGVNRLIAAYETQLGYPKPEEAAPHIAIKAVPPLEKEYLPPLVDAALVPVEPEPPTLVAALRAESLRALALVRQGAARSRQAATRLWLALRIWVSDRFPNRNARC
jgi:hypothetical protein